MAVREQAGFLRGDAPAGMSLGPIVVTPELADAATNRYGGGKQAATATVTATGDTTIVTPPAGQRIRLYWVSAINDPDEATTPLVRIRLGTTELYRAYAIAHWEIFTGAIDEPLVVNLDQTGSVAVTAHYGVVA